jgi:hypothetical protein
MVKMEIGIAASIPWPTFNAEYAEATEKTMQNNTPQKTARIVSSGRVTSAAMRGLYVSPFLRGLYAFSGSDCAAVSTVVVWLIRSSFSSSFHAHKI